MIETDRERHAHAGICTLHYPLALVQISRVQIARQRAFLWGVPVSIQVR